MTRISNLQWHLVQVQARFGVRIFVLCSMFQLTYLIYITQPCVISKGNSTKQHQKQPHPQKVSEGLDLVSFFCSPCVTHSIVLNGNRALWSILGKIYRKTIWALIISKMDIQEHFSDISPLSNMILWIFPWIFAWVYPKISACCSLRNLGQSQPYK